MGCINNKSQQEQPINFDNAATIQKSQGEKPEIIDERSLQILKQISGIPIMKMLSELQRREVAKFLKEKTFSAGDVLMTEGDEGNEFFLLCNGKCEVFIGKSNVSSLQQNDYCGEQALLNVSAKRTATVRCVEETTCLVMDRETFQSVLRSTSMEFSQKRQMHLALTEVDEEEYEGKDSVVDEDKKITDIMVVEWLATCVQKNMLFADMLLSDIQQIVQYMKKINVEADELIICQGEENEYEFFVIEDGEFVVEKNGLVVDQIVHGSCVGELALVFNAPRNASIRSRTIGTAWVLNRSQYRSYSGNIRRKDDEDKIAFLRKIPMLGSLYNSEIALMSRALQRCEYMCGVTIFTQGEDGDKFYLIMEGSVVGEEVRDNDDPKKFELSVGEWFGELALRYDKPRTATIATQCKCVFLEVNRKDFNALFGNLNQMMERQIEEYQRPVQSKKESRQALLHRSLGDFERGPMVGRGKFGAVQFVFDHSSSKTYALKMVKKSWVHSLRISQSQRRIRAIFNERNVMREFRNDNSQFLVQLRGTFKDDIYIYFLIEAALGGDFFNVLKTRGSVCEKTAQFYTACLIEGIDHLHSHNLIHRDLKPENIVLDSRGYGMLTDFGFTMKLGVSQKTYTMCGTPGYMAPEVILGQGYGKGADWFSLGCVLYDFVTGAPPFPSRADQFAMIRQMMQNKLYLPMYLSFWVKDLIRKLLELKIVKRYGVIKGGAQKIRDHRWFQDFDWEALRNGTMQAPIQPAINGPMDVSNFDVTSVNKQMASKRKEPKIKLLPELENWEMEF